MKILVYACILYDILYMYVNNYVGSSVNIIYIQEYVCVMIYVYCIYTGVCMCDDLCLLYIYRSMYV